MYDFIIIYDREEIEYSTIISADDIDEAKIDFRLRYPGISIKNIYEDN